MFIRVVAICIVAAFLGILAYRPLGQLHFSAPEASGYKAVGAATINLEQAIKASETSDAQPLKLRSRLHRPKDGHGATSPDIAAGIFLQRPVASKFSKENLRLHKLNRVFLI
jgi:hypothetical protein